METGESADSLCGYPVLFCFWDKIETSKQGYFFCRSGCAFVLDLFVTLVYIGSSIDEIRQLIIITEMLLDEKSF